MEKNYKLSVPDIHQRIRIDKYIARFIENASRTKVQKAINLGSVTVNGDIVKSNYILKPFDEIEIDLPASESQDIFPEDIPLDIIFEDEYLMVVNKPAGMVTHPAYKNYSGTLVNAVMYYSQNTKGSLSNLNGFERAGIVHRLDKDTSGLLVVAKDEVTHRGLAEQFFVHSVEREYNALTWGKMKKKSGVIENRLGRDKRDRKKMDILGDNEEGGKLAITNYKVLEEYNFFSFLSLKLKTGRTHQIRIHLSHAGHPVFGDETYGGRRASSVILTARLKATINNLLEIMPRQALHAKVLGFVHPRTSEELRFESKLPADMQEVMDRVKRIDQ